MDFQLAGFRGEATVVLDWTAADSSILLNQFLEKFVCPDAALQDKKETLINNTRDPLDYDINNLSRFSKRYFCRWSLRLPALRAIVLMMADNPLTPRISKEEGCLADVPKSHRYRLLQCHAKGIAKGALI